MSHFAWLSQYQHWKQIVWLDQPVHTSSIQPLPCHTTNKILDTQKNSQAYLSDRDCNYPAAKTGNTKCRWVWMKITNKIHTGKKHTYLSSIQCQSKGGIEDPWKRRDGRHNMRCIKPPVERVLRSPHEAENPQSHSQFSSWCARKILCNL